MNRLELQKLANTRLEDAKILLDNNRWAGAYYLTGYAVECGLQACLLKYLGESGAVFGEQTYLKRLADCWTHDLVKLVSLAGLDADFGAARGANPTLEACWGVTKDWNESSRYEEKTEAEAKALFEAVSNDPDRVFLWLKSRW